MNKHKTTGLMVSLTRFEKKRHIKLPPPYAYCSISLYDVVLSLKTEDWKTSNIVPVFKKGKPSHVESYRPISLLSKISKVLERCILVKTRNQLLQYISENQHDFVPGRSCTTQLVEVLECIGQQLDLGKQTDIIFGDMSKAFDRVQHLILVEKLRTINIKGNLHSWFSSCLCGRKQRITLPGGTSSTLAVTSRRSTTLHPWLYTVPCPYVNEIHNIVTSSSVSMLR